MSSIRRALGCTYESLAVFRVALGTLLLLELILRYRFLRAFYSDEGTLPLNILLPKIDFIYKTVCIHCHFGALWQQQLLLSLQVGVALLFTIGFYSRLTAIISWFLYFSLTLRNTWLSYILDRYFHYLFFLSMFLPLDECWSVTSYGRRPHRQIFLSPATLAFKMLVVWIYLDAGYGKYADPLGGWTYHADPLPALDTYARHTVMAQYVYALLGPSGLRLLTPLVVYVELSVAPLSLAASWVGSKLLLWTCIALIWSLHLGIAGCIRNSTLLSLVACTAWIVFLPIGWSAPLSEDQPQVGEGKSSRAVISGQSFLGSMTSACLVGSMLIGNAWFGTMSSPCSQSMGHIWSSLFHNRWNVFVGAEEYVTWEIAPGELRDGSIVDVWGRRDTVDWSLPGTGAPCTSTARPGRWRSFPYLAELNAAESIALWGYLCREWNRENKVDSHPEKELVRFNFFMLQADVLPEMGFSPTRKRKIKFYECESLVGYVQKDPDHLSVDPHKEL